MVQIGSHIGNAKCTFEIFFVRLVKRLEILAKLYDIVNMNSHIKNLKSYTLQNVSTKTRHGQVVKQELCECIRYMINDSQKLLHAQEE